MFSRLWIDETKCDNFIEAARQYRKEWDEKNLIFKDNPLHDWTSHYADMLRYTALAENDMLLDDDFRELMEENEENYNPTPYK